MTQTILITGANRGIGLELARSFLGDGWQVIACCRHPDEAVAIQQIAAEAQGQLRIQQLEVTDSVQIHQLAESLAEQPLEILFNNAGIFGPIDQDFGELDEAWWLETLRVNLVAPMKITEALVENLARSDRPVVAFMGSQLGCLGDNTSGGMYVYRTSKAAVHMLARCLASDLRPRGIIAVALHPGWVRTRMGGPQAPLEPAQSAAGLTRVLLSLSRDQSGKLLTFEGTELSW